MRIHFVRTGGFGGLQLTVDLDTGNMGREEGLKIEQLVTEAEFFDLPARSVASSGGADRFEYLIQVSSRTRGTHGVTMTEQTIPERLQPLLLRLIAMARRQKHGPSDAPTIDEGPPVP